jgi:LysM repeat protein
VNQKHNIPIVSLVVNPTDFFPPTGIYEGTMSSSGGADSVVTVGRAWDKIPITGFAQFFFNGSLQDELELDIKTYGGMTLGWKEKSLQLSARKEQHGRGKIKVKLFEQIPQREFQHVVLRTSGNDQNKTRLKDISISEVANDMLLNTKASRAVALYINGQYWGIHNLREKVNEDYFKERYDWKEKEFTELQGSGSKNARYTALNDFVNNHYRDSDFPEKLADSLDIENFFNYHIFETYISNVDYRGNIRFFKHNKGKWKWLVYDTDLACSFDFLQRNFIRDRTFPTSEYWYNPTYATGLLHHILLNDKLKERFIRQYLFAIATHLRPSNFYEKIDQNALKIGTELAKHFERRGNLYSEDSTSWLRNVKNLKTYFSRRPQSAIQHLKELFKFSETPCNLTITQNVNSFKSLRPKDVSSYVDTISGVFFKELNFEIDASSTNHMYIFSKWSDGDLDSIKNFKLTQDTNVIAEYKHRKKSDNAGNLRLAHYYVNNNWSAPLIFIALVNTSTDDLNLAEYKLFEDKTQSLFQFPEVTLGPKEYVFLTNNDTIFAENVKSNKARSLIFLEGKSFLTDPRLVVLDSKQNWVDSMEVAISDSLQIEHGAFLVNRNEKGEVDVNSMKLKDLNEVEFKWASEDEEQQNGTGAALWIYVFVLFLALIYVIWEFRKMKKIFIGFLVIVACTNLCWSQNFADSCIRKDRFGYSAIDKRFIDNKGLGDERFLGTRNIRVVLYDLVYRGGGNNLYLRDSLPKTFFWHPLPIYGIGNLHLAGFTKAYYLYSNSFEERYPKERLDSLKEKGFSYVCTPSLDSAMLVSYFKEVQMRAQNPELGSMYIHCWNGWHQSGLLSAYTLMQFCDYSNEQALKYWETCTDGNHEGFAKVKERIRKYVPMKGVKFTSEQKEKFCPCETELQATNTQSDSDKLNVSQDSMMEKPKVEPKKPATINKSRKHTVKAGETLSSIARKHKTTVAKIKTLNKLKSDVIHPGDILKIP